jgi:MazG family protein
MTSDLHPLLRFIEVVQALRHPKTGCPWDLEQSHQSLRPYFIEEVHEFLEAESKGSLKDMEEELGDVLLQIYLHSRLLEEHTQGQISIDSVANTIVDKMVRRHPHVFADVIAKDSKTVLENWQEIKQSEKPQTKKEDPFESTKSFPALMGMDLALKKLKKAGFRFDSPWQALDKVEEETREVRQCKDKPQDLREELSDLLLACVSTIAEFNYSAEDLMLEARQKLSRRWKKYEDSLQESGLDLESMSFEDKEALWNRIKHGA